MPKLTRLYEGFRGSTLWKRIDRAVLDLATNHDIRLGTRRQYVVGYICHMLTHYPRKTRTRKRKTV